MKNLAPSKEMRIQPPASDYTIIFDTEKDIITKIEKRGVDYTKQLNSNALRELVLVLATIYKNANNAIYEAGDNESNCDYALYNICTIIDNDAPSEIIGKCKI